MGRQIQLYALPGLPLHVEDLMPQPLLARCAGSLTAQGHAVLVVDEGSLERLELNGLPALTAALNEHLAHTECRLDGWVGRFSARERHLRRALERFRNERVTQAVAAHRSPAPELALIQIQRHKDVADARSLAQRLKSLHPALTIIVAGDFVNQYARPLLLGSPEFDCACLGSPESLVASVARNLTDRDRWNTTPGLVFRQGRGIQEGQGMALPIDPCFASADYHPSRYPSLLDGGKIKLFTLPQTTGYSHVGHYRGGHQPRGRVVREYRQMRSDIEQLHRLYGAETFHITGSHTPSSLVQRFASECLTLPFSIRYSREAHVHELDGEAVHTLALSGCQAVGLSLLTGSQWALSDYYGENWTISEAEASQRRIRAQGIYLHTTFTFPCPADDYHTRAETFRIIRRNRPDGVRIALPRLVPGSAWYQHAEEFNYSLCLKRFEAWVATPPFAATARDETTHLPYHWSGLRSSAVAALHEDALRELAELQFEAVSGPTAALMARVSGYTGREAEFTRTLDQSALRLDIARLREAIDVFNIGATSSINTIDLYPPVSIKKAVGN